MLKIVADTSLRVENIFKSQEFEIQSDLVYFGLSPCCVTNGSLYSIYDSLGISPGSIYPYGRLASINTNSTAFLYHQVNGSIVMEEMMALARGLGAWLKPNMISVPAH